MGYAVVTPTTQLPSPVKVSQLPEGFELENEFVVAKINHGGQLISLFDKQYGRECVESNKKANQFVLFDDNPVNFDAWDVNI
jgi:alpha-mannosidase